MSDWVVCQAVNNEFWNDSAKACFFFIQRSIFLSLVFTLFHDLETLLSDMAKKVSSANRIVSN